MKPFLFQLLEDCSFQNYENSLEQGTKENGGEKNPTAD
jgi:hypothetical protein